jgi:hypothetical protein
MIRIGFLLLLMVCCQFVFSQTDVGIKVGVAPWNINHQNKSISKPISLNYSAGLAFEQIVNKSPFGVYTGIEYSYCRMGTPYIDLTDERDLMAGVIVAQVNERFINVAHQEIAVPLLFVFYYNALRTGVGVEYNRYFFPEPSSANNYLDYNDWGLRFVTGTRFSKYVAFSIGYYYGMNKPFQLVTASESGKSPLFSGNMQQIEASLTFSLFNTMERESGYMIQPLNQ